MRRFFGAKRTRQEEEWKRRFYGAETSDGGRRGRGNSERMGDIPLTPGPYMAKHFHYTLEPPVAEPSGDDKNERVDDIPPTTTPLLPKHVHYTSDPPQKPDVYDAILDLELLREWVRQSAHVNLLLEENGGTILHLAAGEGELPVVKYLVEQAGAIPDAPDIQGKTPLDLVHEAREKILSDRGLHNDRRAKMLDQYDKIAEYVSQFVREEPQEDELEREQQDTQEMQQGATDESQVSSIANLFTSSTLDEYDGMWNLGLTSMQEACLYEEVDEICKVLKFRADSQSKDTGRKPCSYAVGGGHIQAVKAKNGMTPLHWAATGGDKTTVKTLVEIGKVDVFIENDDGKTALDLVGQIYNAKPKVALEDFEEAYYERVSDVQQYLEEVSTTRKEKPSLLQASLHGDDMPFAQSIQKQQEAFQTTLSQSASKTSWGGEPTNTESFAGSGSLSFDGSTSIVNAESMREASKRLQELLDRVSSLTPASERYAVIDCELVQALVADASANFQQEREKRAILRSRHAVFFLTFTRKLFDMMSVCENLSTGMVAQGTLVSELRDTSRDGIREARVTQLVAEAAAFSASLVPHPVAEPLSSLFRLISTRLDGGQRQVGVACAADAATLLALQNKDSLRLAVVRLACIFVRAREHASGEEKRGGEINEPSRFDKLMIRLLGANARSPEKEHGYIAAETVLAKVMEKEWDHGLGERSATDILEILAMEVLGFDSVDDVRALKLFALGECSASNDSNDPTNAVASRQLPPMNDKVDTSVNVAGFGRPSAALPAASCNGLEAGSPAAPCARHLPADEAAHRREVESLTARFEFEISMLKRGIHSLSDNRGDGGTGGMGVENVRQLLLELQTLQEHTRTLTEELTAMKEREREKDILFSEVQDIAESNRSKISSLKPKTKGPWRFNRTQRHKGNSALTKMLQENVEAHASEQSLAEQSATENKGQAPDPNREILAAEWKGQPEQQKVRSRERNSAEMNILDE